MPADIFPDLGAPAMSVSSPIAGLIYPKARIEELFHIFATDHVAIVVDAVIASEAAARLGDVHAARDLYEQLLPFAGSLAIGPTEGSIGPIDYYLGLLASAGDLAPDGADAERHLRAAIRLNEQMNAAPWRARARPSGDNCRRNCETSRSET